MSVDLAGINLRYPLILASGSQSWDGRTINNIAQHKVGAIVTKTMRMIGVTPQNYALEPNPIYQPFMRKIKGGLLNADWTDIGFDAWLNKELKIAKESNIPIIASIGYLPPYGKLNLLPEMVSKLVDSGIDMIQIYN